ncbi:alpha/beta hydrolase [Pedobacter psychrodurus]|uniref:Alpha/beta hydrolase n=1 Tax=Pedobacter psychrodurus TaxID=2530456 RepID=A0A4R0PVC9_9SPHI|nr:alpha/beta hydrolase [Pedobacter psychrodurus]TCD26520.1 alpha/beta hydrolase [Pedobacter psychrodurus]
MSTVNFKGLLILLFLTLAFSLQAFSQGQPALRAFMQAGPSPENAIPYGNNPKAGHFIQSDDAKIYYEVYGKGKPLVILHGGIFGSTYEMGRFIDSLSKKFMVIAVSTRGHGKSEMGSVEPSYEQKARDVNVILNKETRDSAIVLGFSDGAYTSYYLAGQFPSKVKSIIAIGAGVWAKGERIFSLSKQMAFGLDSLYYKQQLSLMPEPKKIDLWYTSVNQYYNKLEVGKEVFEKIHSPVLLLAGELDQNAPLQTVIDAYHMISVAQLGIIPNAPHPAFLVNFEAVWADIVPFIGCN